MNLLLDPANYLVFSSASLWEISIKNGFERPDFNVDPRRLWRMLLVNGYRELPVTCEHTIAEMISHLCTKTRSTAFLSHKRVWRD